MDSQTVTAKKNRTQMIQVYNTYHDLLVQRINKLMEKTISEEENHLEALKLAKERSDERTKKTKLKYEREIKLLKETNTELNNQLEEMEEENTALKSSIDIVKQENMELLNVIKTIADVIDPKSITDRVIRNRLIQYKK